jgi:hypothetical protein
MSSAFRMYVLLLMKLLSLSMTVPYFMKSVHSTRVDLGRYKQPMQWYILVISALRKLKGWMENSRPA